MLNGVLTYNAAQNNNLKKFIIDLKENYNRVFCIRRDEATEELYFIKLCVDFEVISDIEKEFHTENAIAIKSYDYGFGIWYCENIGFGLYGDCLMGGAFISLYWKDDYDRLSDIIGQAIAKSSTSVEFFGGFANILEEAIDEYVDLTGDRERYNFGEFQELIKPDKKIEGDQLC